MYPIRRAIGFVLLAGYLSAASTPCPPRARAALAPAETATTAHAVAVVAGAGPAASDIHSGAAGSHSTHRLGVDPPRAHRHAHSHAAHVSPATVQVDRPASADTPLAWNAPCPCGCGDHDTPGAAAWNAKLSAAIAPASAGADLAGDSPLDPALAALVPSDPFEPPEPVPV